MSHIVTIVYLTKPLRNRSQMIFLSVQVISFEIVDFIKAVSLKVWLKFMILLHAPCREIYAVLHELQALIWR